MILFTAAGSRTQRAIIGRLAGARPAMRAFGRSLDKPWLSGHGLVDMVEGDLLDRAAVRTAMNGVETVVHVGPALNGSEAMIGRTVIDVAREQGVGRFVYVSVIHPQIGYLLNHRAKREVEDHLISSRLPFTILQPQHYFQNIDIPAVMRSGVVALPYALNRELGFVDMADLAEVAVKVISETGHDDATYQIASDEHLSGEEIAATLSRMTGRQIATRRIPLEEIVAVLAPHYGKADGNIDASADAVTRLFTYYDRYGIRGNGRVLAWLLGRQPNTFVDYATRGLEGSTQ